MPVNKQVGDKAILVLGDLGRATHQDYPVLSGHVEQWALEIGQWLKTGKDSPITKEPAGGSTVS